VYPFETENSSRIYFEKVFRMNVCSEKEIVVHCDVIIRQERNPVQHGRDSMTVKSRQVHTLWFRKDIGVVYDSKAFVARIHPRWDHMWTFDDNEHVMKPRSVHVQTPQRIEKLLVVSLSSYRVLLPIDRWATHHSWSKGV
jgi:hypothetical protein